MSRAFNWFVVLNKETGHVSSFHNRFEATDSMRGLPDLILISSSQGWTGVLEGPILRHNPIGPTPEEN